VHAAVVVELSTMVMLAALMLWCVGGREVAIRD
jgi:hypothetical protein